MEKINRTTLSNLPAYPERIIQFGEGNFMRAFVDWIIQRMNDKVDFNSSVAVVQPINQGLGEMINAQDGLYNLILVGMKDGQPVRDAQVISCINRCLNPYSEYAAYQQLVESPDVRFVVSNTTEAGIQWADGETLDMQPQASFPGKMTALLHHRFKTFNGAADKGLIILCCELIEDNGDKLKELVLRHAKDWGLEPAFFEWLESSCAFCSTLVDRIVPGYPRDNIDEVLQEIGYEDNLVVVGEYYHNWVIQAPEWVAQEFPADKAGLNVSFVSKEEQRIIRDQKVRILNGSHTGGLAPAYLSGLDTVREAVQDERVGGFIRDMLMEEILPSISGDPAELKQFAEKILERFFNPYIRHEWMSISLNSMSKWETRVLPSLLESLEKSGRLPQRMVLSLAALMAFYRGVRRDQPIACKDNADILELYAKVWGAYDGSAEGLEQLVRTVLGYQVNWKRDLNAVPGLTAAVTVQLQKILDEGMTAAIDALEV